MGMVVEIWFTFGLRLWPGYLPCKVYKAKHLYGNISRYRGGGQAHHSASVSTTTSPLHGIYAIKPFMGHATLNPGRSSTDTHLPALGRLIVMCRKKLLMFFDQTITSDKKHKLRSTCRQGIECYHTFCQCNETNKSLATDGQSYTLTSANVEALGVFVKLSVHLAEFQWAPHDCSLCMTPCLYGHSEPVCKDQQRDTKLAFIIYG